MKIDRNMPKELIYLCRNKLMAIDADLPVLMEIKSLYPKTNVAIVFYNDAHFNLIKKNYHLWGAIESMGASIYMLRAENKFIRVIRTIRFILKFSFKSIVILKTTDVLPLHNIIMKILKRVSTIKEVKTYLRLRSLHGYRTFYIQQALSRERRGLPVKMKFLDGSYNYFFSAIDAAQFKQIFNLAAPEEKLVKVGYVRRLAEWQRYMQEAVKRNKLINDNEYFLYILNYLGDRMLHNFDEPAKIELLEESLNIFKRYNKRIKTIFRPHATTEVRKLEELLKKLDYSNYAIDYGHPIILSSKAKFVFANVFSSTLYDACYLCKPTVEYYRYDPELFVKMGRQSIGGACCDFFIQRDLKKLKEVLDKLVNGNVNIKRDPKFIQENYPDASPEFYELLNKLFS